MNKTLIVACAVAGGLFAALAAPPPAQALPSVSLGIEKNADAVMHLARRGGGGRGMRGRSFGGGRGMRGRSFGGGRGMRGRSYGGGRASRGRAYGGRRGIRGRAYGGRRGIRGRGYRRGRGYGYRGYGKRRYRRRRVRRGRGYGYYGGYYGGTCAWLRQRAYVTGNPYWWRRYNRCIGDYY